MLLGEVDLSILSSASHDPIRQKTWIDILSTDMMVLQAPFLAYSRYDSGSYWTLVQL